ncbi:hypothetical protein [Hydrogenophaga sp.]|uniref:hypothetical protein n=1 Tax=Hydrogenophaga sp. TaxID=1904254 RepID=UPI0019894F67|nr:hypothetical protein [Hydrogenophaga sp.]MBD3894038.1 hypothetical protein [Hydrogenophaga sp.]
MTDFAEPPPAAGDLPQGRFQGRLAFAALVRQALAAAAAQGWNRIILCDADFSDWPLGERATIESLNAWSAHGRSLHLLACDYSALRLQQPRFVQWRQTWSHLVQARACDRAWAGDLPSAIWSSAWTLERLDRVHASLLASRGAERRVLLAERLDHWWQRAGPSFSTDTLGL